MRDEIAAMIVDYNNRWQDVGEAVYSLIELGGVDMLHDMEKELREKHGQTVSEIFARCYHDKAIAAREVGL